MIKSITDNILYIFDSAICLMSALAVVGIVAFYFAISTYILIRTEGKHCNLDFIKARLRDVKIVKILAFSAPMIGLLGTVIGIGKCIAFAEDTAAVSDGISFALLTTQTGLIIAIPAWISAIVLTSKLKKISLECK